MSHNARLILSCEHARNSIPKNYSRYFKNARNVLASHRGYDIGALDLARRFRIKFKAPLHAGEYSRLLIDLNRTHGNKNLFSAYTRILSKAERDYLERTYHQPYVNGIAKNLRDSIRARGSVLHLSIHSFTPVLHGKKRAADIGLLYDPSRKNELEISKCWKAELKKKLPFLRVMSNSPYKGTMDGLTTHMRKIFSDTKYAGVELEVNQKHMISGTKKHGLIVKEILNSFEFILRDLRL